MSTESYLLQIALTILDLLGVAVFSASGVLKAAEKYMDIFDDRVSELPTRAR